MRHDDRIQETSASTGTGTLTLAGATPGHRPFSLLNGEVVSYLITSGTAWEIGTGTVSGSTLTRALVSSSTGSLLDLPAGSHVVSLIISGQTLNSLQDHVASTSNPHTVTKSQVGLSDVDNVSAANLRDRATHTGTQAHTTITGLGTAATVNTGTSGATIPLLSTANTFTGLQSFQASASAATFGADLVTNGTFTGNADGWTLGDGWSYGTNAAVATASAAGTLTQSISVTSGTSYYLEFSAQLSAANNALLNVALGTVTAAAVARTDVTTSNNYAVMLVANTTGTVNLAFSITAISGTGTVTVDNVVLRAVTTIPASVTGRNSAGTVVFEQRALTGSTNVAVGINAFRSNTTGAGNTAAGFSALLSNTTGNNNTAAGLEALLSNTTGGNNTAAGREALLSNTTGGSNTAAGFRVLLNNTTGNNNTAAGLGALFSNTTGNNNTAAGLGALFSNTTGNNNVAQGFNAGRYAGSGWVGNETSNNSTYFGYQTRSSASGNTNEVVIGYDVVGAGSNTSSIGNSSTTLAKLFGNTLQLTASRTPASATATGAAGEICWDTDFLHVATATNTWQKVSLSIPSIGTNANQIPVNGYLGPLAYQSTPHVEFGLRPIIPLTSPTVQQVINALLALGLVRQEN